ncbi:MAG: BrnA antitoxin family protein [Chloroflexota bacterium]
MTDEEIDYSNIPPLDEAFFDRARVWRPRQKVTVAVQLDSDVLAWFQAQGDEWEKRMRAALRIYVEAHKEQLVSAPAVT